MESMTLEKIPDGWINIYGILHGQLIQERFLYYNVRGAKKLFREKYNLKKVKWNVITY